MKEKLCGFMSYLLFNIFIVEIQQKKKNLTVIIIYKQFTFNLLHVQFNNIGKYNNNNKI